MLGWETDLEFIPSFSHLVHGIIEHVRKPGAVLRCVYTMARERTEVLPAWNFCIIKWGGRVIKKQRIKLAVDVCLCIPSSWKGEPKGGALLETLV